ncbi:MAG: WD40/YVTN/BNR-like repeat-containing protein [Acidobacteriota bacterium]
MYKSTDGGSSWTPLQANSLLFLGAVDSIAVDPITPSVVYAAGVAGCRPPCAAPSFAAIERSGDGGATWSITASTGLVDFTKTSLAITFDSVVYAGNTSGVVRTTNGGSSWLPAEDGLTNRSVLSLTTDGLRLYAGTDGDGVFATLAVPNCGGSRSLCLNSGRFRVEVSWTASNIGQSGAGQAIPLTSDSGAFWFFQPSNIELVVKVLDGRAINGHFWVFYGALSNVGYTITVTDTATGESKTYTNPEGQLGSRADTEAF